MLIKSLNIKDHKLIQTFLKKNNSSLPNYDSWVTFNNLSKKNSSFFIDGLFNKNKLVGYHSAILKYIFFKKKKYKVLVSSNWNVSKLHRKASIILINNFFKKKSDLHITTTANEKAARLWSLFGATEVNPASCKIVLFQITNYFIFLSNFFKKKKIYIPKFIIKILSFFLCFFFDKEKKLSQRTISFKKNDYNYNYLEKYNKKFELNCNYPIEQRSNFVLSRYINTLELNKKKVFVYQILKNKEIIGYIVLVIEKYNGLKRMFLGDFKIDKKFEKQIDQILYFAKNEARKNNCTYIYFRFIKPKILKILDKKSFFVSKFGFNPYNIKLSSKRSKILKKYLNNNWETSYFDGDCLL